MDYDEILGRMRKETSLQIAMGLSGWLYWTVALPWISGTDEEKESFRSEFKDHEQARKNACLGNVTAKHFDACMIVNRAASYHRERKEAKDKGEKIDKESSNFLCTSLGLNLIDIVENGNYAMLIQMAEILKEGKSPKKKQGGLKNKYGQMWMAFCHCHLETNRLPRKSEVRKQAGRFDELADSRKAANEELDHLGLGGLME